MEHASAWLAPRYIASPASMNRSRGVPGIAAAACPYAASVSFPRLAIEADRRPHRLPSEFFECGVPFASYLVEKDAGHPR